MRVTPQVKIKNLIYKAALLLNQIAETAEKIGVVTKSKQTKVKKAKFKKKA
jgi:hypothetical protein